MVLEAGRRLQVLTIITVVVQAAPEAVLVVLQASEQQLLSPTTLTATTPPTRTSTELFGECQTVIMCVTVFFDMDADVTEFK